MQMDTKLIIAVEVLWTDGDLSTEEEQASQIEDALNAFSTDSIDRLLVKKVYCIAPHKEFDDHIIEVTTLDT